MTSKPLLVYNPIAGKGKAATLLPKVQALLAERGFDYELALTGYVGHAQELSHQAAQAGRPLVIAAGGDGTVNEVINGLMQSHGSLPDLPALGVLPVGRGNDFSFGIGVPPELNLACDILSQNHRQKMDVGHVRGGDYPQGRYFGNGVGLGFDTVVGFEAAKMKWLHGGVTYVVGMLRAMFIYAHAPIYELITDQEHLTQPFLLVSVMNGKRMGGAFLMAPQGKHGDGYFDLCLAGQCSQLGMLPLAISFMSGTQGQNPVVRMIRAQRVSVRAIQGTIPAHADGETICTAGTNIDIELIPDALNVVVKLEETEVL